MTTAIKAYNNCVISRHDCSKYSFENMAKQNRSSTKQGFPRLSVNFSQISRLVVFLNKV